MRIGRMAKFVAVFSILGVASVAFAQTRWATYTNREYGITMLMPDIEHCVAAEQGDIGHIVCRYPEGLQIDVMGSPTALTLTQLRDEAGERITNVPQSAWQWRTINDAENGYRFAESWTAHGGGNTVIGLIGQSSRRTMSHIVYIHGSDAAFQRHQAQVALFINSIHAI